MMTSPTSNSMERMLARISGALGRSASSVPESLRPFTSRAGLTDVMALTERFCAELELVGGRVTCVNSSAEVRAYLKGLLPADEVACVALSDGAAVSATGVRECLEEAGASLVQTWREFAAARGLSGTLNGEARETNSVDEVAQVFEQYKRQLIQAHVGVTSADYALADTGTLVLLAGVEQHRLISLLPPVHVCLLKPKRILWSLTQLLAQTDRRFNASEHDEQEEERPPQVMTCITGPSRTADIEQVITMGVHGPQELHVLLYEVDEEFAV